MSDKPENPQAFPDHEDGWCVGCDLPWEQCDCTFLAYECGMLADGTCLKAGSEECDWECPRGGLDYKALSERVRQGKQNEE